MEGTFEPHSWVFLTTDQSKVSVKCNLCYRTKQKGPWENTSCLQRRRVEKPRLHTGRCSCLRPTTENQSAILSDTRILSFKAHKHASTLAFWACLDWEYLPIQCCKLSPTFPVEHLFVSVIFSYQPFVLERDALRGRDHLSPLPSSWQAATPIAGLGVTKHFIEHLWFLFCLLVCLFVFVRFLLCTLAELCSPGWPQTLGNPPVSLYWAGSTGCATIYCWSFGIQ